MITSTQSAEEAKQSSILTFVALIFAPMTLVSNILAMSGGFQPGEHMFYYYFAISIPLTLLVFLVVLVFRLQNKRDENSAVNKAAVLFSSKAKRQVSREILTDLEFGGEGKLGQAERYKGLM
jgi:uncharacterized membrane protein